MSDDEIIEAMAEIAGPRLYVIVKRGYFYRENAGGYTGSIIEAWKLPLEQAKQYEMYADRDDVPQCEKVLIQPAPLPDFLNDLDAVHEVEKKIVREYGYEYTQLLKAECGTQWGFASARQRCENILKASGKGKEAA